MARDRFHVGGTEKVDDSELRDRLGPRLRRCRRERGMTMVVLAASAQCSQSFLSKVESGILLPSLPMLQRLSRALEISMSALLDDKALDHP